MNLIEIEKCLIAMGKENWNQQKDKLAVEIEHGKKLHDQVVAKRPQVIVEVGTGHGYSTAWMLLALANIDLGHLYSIDIEAYPDNEPVWKKLGLSTRRLSVMRGSLKQFIEVLPTRIDMIFLDSDHQIHNIVDDIEMLMPHLTIGGMIAVHDVAYIEEMGNCLKDYFHGINSDKLNHCGVTAKPDNKWMYEEFKSTSGLGIATKKGETK